MSESPATPGEGGERLLAGHGGRLLLSVSLTWFVVVAARLLLPPLLPTIIADFGITLSTAGLLLTVLQAASALALYPSGRLSDGLSRATVIVPAFGLLTVGALLIAGAPAYLALVAGAATFGLGQGLFSIAARALISDHFVERRGRALGVFQTGFNLGGILASGVAVVALARWQLPYVAVAGLLALMGALFVAWNREPYVFAAVRIDAVPTVRRLLTTRALREPLVAYALFFVVTQSFLGFFPAYLQDAKGFTPALASGAFALVFVVGIASKLLIGGFSDRVSRVRVAVASMVLAMAGLGGLVLAGSTPAVVAFTALFAVGHQAQFPLMDAILLDAAPEGNVGGDLGAARTVFQLVGSLGPVSIGVAAQTYGYTAGFAGLAALLAASAGLLVAGERQG